MKILKEKEVTICDYPNCEKEDCYDECFICGATYCCDHKKTNGIELEHGVYCSGSGDIFICNKCHANIDKVTPEQRELYLVYMRIAALRQETQLINKDFNERKEAAENEATVKYNAYKMKNNETRTNK